MRSMRARAAFFALLLCASAADAANFGYVPINDENGVVEVVNMTTRQWVKQIAIGRNAYTTTVHPNGTRVYVGAVDSDGVGVVSIIDTSRNAMIRTITEVSDAPTELVVRPGDAKVLFSSHNRGVDMIDIDETVAEPYAVKKITTKYSGQGLGVTADGQYVVVAGKQTLGGDLWGVSLVNAQTGVAISNLDLPKDVTGLTVNNKSVFVTNRSGNNITELEITNYDTPDVAALKKVGESISLKAGSGPYDLIVDRLFNRLIVSNSGAPSIQAGPEISSEGSLALINLSTREITYTDVSMEGQIKFSNPVVHPQALSLSQDGKTLHITKQLWAQSGGTYVSSFRVVASGLKDEVGTGNINPRNAYNMGDFVGPECPKCPLYKDNITFTTRKAPAAVSPLELLAFAIFGGAMWLARRRFR